MAGMTGRECVAMIRSDAARCNVGLVRWVLWNGPTGRFLTLLRVGRWSLASSVRVPVRAICRVSYRRYSHRYNVEIPYSTSIGRGFNINHLAAGGIVVNANATIGDDVTMFHGVTLATTRMKGYPIIGDGVQLGVGSVVVGGVTIGDRATVGANAVVTKDVAPGVTVGGVPAVPLRHLP